MLLAKLLQATALLSAHVAALAVGGKPDMVIKPYETDGLQDIVTWDEVPVKSPCETRAMY